MAEEKPVISTKEDGYTLSYMGESSEVVPFGQPLEIELGGVDWLCGVDLPQGADVSTDTEAMFNHWLYKVEPVEDEDIEFDDDDDDADDDDDEDDSDDDGGDRDDDGGDRDDDGVVIEDEVETEATIQ